MSWKLTSVTEICEEIVDCVNRTAPVVEQRTPYLMIRTSNIKGGRIHLDDVKFVTKEIYDKWTRRSIPRIGDVLLTREAPVGEVGMVRTDDKVFLGQRIVMYRANKELCDPRFLYYYFQTPYVQAQIHAFSSGSTVAHVKVPDAKKILVKLPSIEDQNRIADILSTYDELIENNLRRIQLLDEAIRCRYKLTMVASKTQLKKLGNECELIMGQSPPSSTYNNKGEGLPFHQGVTNYGYRFLSHENFCTAPAKIAEPGDILISVRAPVGRLNFTTEKICIGRGLAGVRHRSGYQQFQYQTLKDFFFVEDRIGNGSTFNATTKKELEGLELPYPEEKYIMEFERAAVPMHKQMVNLTRQNYLLRQARDILLPRIMSGEIDITSVILPRTPEEVLETIKAP